MAFYKVLGMSICFSQAPSQTLMLKCISVMFRLEGRRYVKLLFVDHEVTYKRFNTMPSFLEMPVDLFAKIVPCVSTTITEPVILHDKLIT